MQFLFEQHKRKHVLDLYIGGTRVKQTGNPKFLGVTYDRQLRFNAHVRDVTKKVINRSRVLYILSGTDWGYDKATLRRTYIATGITVIQYAGPSWKPRISKTSFEELERSQRFAARASTGQFKTIPVQDVLYEAELSTIQCTATQQAAIAFDKSLWLTSTNPRRNIAEKRIQQRTTMQSWRSKTTESWKTIFGTKIEAAPFSWT